MLSASWDHLTGPSLKSAIQAKTVDPEQPLYFQLESLNLIAASNFML